MDCKTFLARLNEAQNNGIVAWDSLPSSVLLQIGAACVAHEQCLLHLARVNKSWRRAIVEELDWKGLIVERFGDALPKGPALPVEIAGWTFYPGWDSGSNDIKQLQNLIQLPAQIAEVAEKEDEAVAFNTNGWIKRILKPQREWNHFSFEPGQGLYVRNNLVQALRLRQPGPIILDIPTFAGWTFFPGVDTPGGVLDWSQDHLAVPSLQHLAHVAESLPKCVAFNTFGEFKDRVRSPASWVDLSSTWHGVWIRDDLVAQENLVPSSGKIDYRKLFYGLSRLRRSAAADMNVTHLNGTYLARVQDTESHYPEVVKLNSVCWLELRTTFRGVPPGRYRLVWRMRAQAQVVLTNIRMAAKVSAVRPVQDFMTAFAIQKSAGGLPSTSNAEADGTAGKRTAGSTRGADEQLNASALDPVMADINDGSRGPSGSSIELADMKASSAYERQSVVIDGSDATRGSGAELAGTKNSSMHGQCDDPMNSGNVAQEATGSCSKHERQIASTSGSAAEPAVGRGDNTYDPQTLATAGGSVLSGSGAELAGVGNGSACERQTPASGGCVAFNGSSAELACVGHGSSLNQQVDTNDGNAVPSGSSPEQAGQAGPSNRDGRPSERVAKKPRGPCIDWVARRSGPRMMTVDDLERALGEIGDDEEGDDYYSDYDGSDDNMGEMHTASSSEHPMMSTENGQVVPEAVHPAAGGSGGGSDMSETEDDDDDDDDDYDDDGFGSQQWSEPWNDDASMLSDDDDEEENEDDGDEGDRYSQELENMASEDMRFSDANSACQAGDTISRVVSSAYWQRKAAVNHLRWFDVQVGFVEVPGGYASDVSVSFESLTNTWKRGLMWDYVELVRESD